MREITVQTCNTGASAQSAAFLQNTERIVFLYNHKKLSHSTHHYSWAKDFSAFEVLFNIQDQSKVWMYSLEIIIIIIMMICKCLGMINDVDISLQHQYPYKQLTKVKIRFSAILRRISGQQEFFKFTDGWEVSAFLDSFFLEYGWPPLQKLVWYTLSKYQNKILFNLGWRCSELYSQPKWIGAVIRVSLQYPSTIQNYSIMFITLSKIMT